MSRKVKDQSSSATFSLHIFVQVLGTIYDKSWLAILHDGRSPDILDLAHSTKTIVAKS